MKFTFSTGLNFVASSALVLVLLSTDSLQAGSILKLGGESLSEIESISKANATNVAIEEGRSGKCFYFSDSTSSIAIPGSRLIHPGCGTIQMWVKNIGFSKTFPNKIKTMFYAYYGKGIIFTSFISYGESQPEIVTLGRMPRAKENDTDLDKYDDQKIAYFPRKEGWGVDEWHFVAWTWGNEKVKFYLDGILKETCETPGFLAKRVYEDSVFIGGAGGGRDGFEEGYIDDIEAFDSEMSAGEILNAFTFNSTQEEK